MTLIFYDPFNTLTYLLSCWRSVMYQKCLSINFPLLYEMLTDFNIVHLFEDGTIFIYNNMILQCYILSWG